MPASRHAPPPARAPRGTPAGGRYARTETGEATLTLHRAAPEQTAADLDRMAVGETLLVARAHGGTVKVTAAAGHWDVLTPEGHRHRHPRPALGPGAATAEARALAVALHDPPRT